LPTSRRGSVRTALASSQLRDFDGARTGPGNSPTLCAADAGALRQAQLLAAEIELAAGDAHAALQYLPAVHAKAPEKRPNCCCARKPYCAAPARPTPPRWPTACKPG